MLYSDDTFIDLKLINFIINSEHNGINNKCQLQSINIANFVNSKGPFSVLIEYIRIFRYGR